MTKMTKTTALLEKGNVLDRLNSVASEIVQHVLDSRREVMNDALPVNIVMPIYMPPTMKITIEYGSQVEAEYAVFKAKNSGARS